MKTMLTKGDIVNEFGERVGKYWHRDGMNRFSIVWCGIRINGFTQEGLIKWLNEKDYYIA